ncbi:MAG TPA: NAD(P)-dependent alcohol dehydrogenase [Candidatus Limnocylindrales bacterium]
MSPSTVDGYAAMAMGQALEPLSYPAPPLGEHDVRVAISHCGVCFTDIQGIDDFYGITGFPFVPGHEIVGHVEALGREVTGLAEGDRVGIGWQGRSCERCAWCVQGEEQLCQDIAEMGTWERHGGFASSVTVDGRFAFPLPEAMAPEVAAVLMCAGVSVYSPLRACATGSGLRVGILGVGGLGHLAIQFAHALGCEVTALSSSPAKEQEAITFGADQFVVTGDRARMRSIDYAFDLVLCTAHGAIDWEELLMTLRKRGRLVLVGFPEVSMNPTDIVAHELSITGSFLGNRTKMREMLPFARDHGITPRVEQLPMA